MRGTKTDRELPLATKAEARALARKVIAVVDDWTVRTWEPPALGSLIDELRKGIDERKSTMRAETYASLDGYLEMVAKQMELAAAAKAHREA